MASTTDLARRVLNSSTFTEPCLVRSAKQILLRTSVSDIMLAVASAYPGLPRSGELVRPNAGASDRAECSQCSFACRVFLNGKVHNEYRKGLN